MPSAAADAPWPLKARDLHTVHGFPPTASGAVKGEVQIKNEGCERSLFLALFTFMPKLLRGYRPHLC
jgi:hypothetical protein